MSIRLSAYLENHTAELYQFFLTLPVGRGSVLLWRRRDTLCSSGFVDDAVFSHNSPMTDGSGVFLCSDRARQA